MGMIHDSEDQFKMILTLSTGLYYSSILMNNEEYLMYLLTSCNDISATLIRIFQKYGSNSKESSGQIFWPKPVAQKDRTTNNLGMGRELAWSNTALSWGCPIVELSPNGPQYNMYRWKLFKSQVCMTSTQLQGVHSWHISPFESTVCNKKNKDIQRIPLFPHPKQWWIVISCRIDQSYTI